MKASNARPPNTTGGCRKAKPPLGAAWRYLMWRCRGRAPGDGSSSPRRMFLYQWNHTCRANPPCLLFWQISLHWTRQKIRHTQHMVKENLKSSDRLKEAGRCWTSVVREHDRLVCTVSVFPRVLRQCALGSVLYTSSGKSCFYLTFLSTQKTWLQTVLPAVVETSG